MPSKYDKAEMLVAALREAGFRADTTRKGPTDQRHPASVWVWGTYNEPQIRKMEEIAKKLDPTARVYPPIDGHRTDVLIDAFIPPPRWSMFDSFTAMPDGRLTPKEE